MIGRISAQLGLLTFAAAVLMGLSVGNSAETILERALLATVPAVFIAQFAAWCCKQVVREHVRRRKMTIDKAHFADRAAISAAETGGTGEA